MKGIPCTYKNYRCLMLYSWSCFYLASIRTKGIESENVYQETTANQVMANLGYINVLLGSESKFTMIIKKFDSEERIDPKQENL